MDKPFVVRHLFCNTYPLPSHSCSPVPTTEKVCTNQTWGEKQPPPSMKEILDHSLASSHKPLHYNGPPAYALITLDWWETKKNDLGFGGLHLWFTNTQQMHHRHIFFGEGTTTKWSKRQESIITIICHYFPQLNHKNFFYSKHPPNPKKNYCYLPSPKPEKTLGKIEKKWKMRPYSVVVGTT